MSEKNEKKTTNEMDAVEPQAESAVPSLSLRKEKLKVLKTRMKTGVRTGRNCIQGSDVGHCGIPSLH